MAVIDVYNLQKEKTSQMELKEEIFGVPIKKQVLHQVVVSQLHARRSGSASVKSRSEVRGSGAKLWRQKGTGRARVGAASSPTRSGGGVAFGPSIRSYAQNVPKKVRKGALRMALTADERMAGVMPSTKGTLYDSFTYLHPKAQITRTNQAAITIFIIFLDFRTADNYFRKNCFVQQLVCYQLFFIIILHKIHC